MAKPDEIAPLACAMTSDVVTAIGASIPGISTATHLVVSISQRVEAWNREKGTELLIEEISKGTFEEIRFEEYEVDPFLEIIHRYSKAVTDGASRRNLRLLAQIIAGQIERRPIDSDEFRRWCGILEQLTHEELLVIGTSFKVDCEVSCAEDARHNAFWSELLSSLNHHGLSESEVLSIAASISRTGLLVPAPANIIGGPVYVPSPWLGQLAGLVDLNEFQTGEGD